MLLLILIYYKYFIFKIYHVNQFKINKYKSKVYILLSNYHLIDSRDMIFCHPKTQLLTTLFIWQCGLLASFGFFFFLKKKK
jgi:hypothetical protein